MSTEKLKVYLHQIANNLKEGTAIEEVYEQLSLLQDIDESENQVKNGETFSNTEVIERSKEWLK